MSNGESATAKSNASTSISLERFFLPRRLARFDEVLAKRTRQVTVVLDQIANGRNVSAVMRSADAFGIQDIHLVGERHKFNRMISLGAERWLEFYYHATPGDALTALEQQGYRIAILAPADKHPEKSVAVDDLPAREKIALVFGNEISGVRDEFAERASYFASIPMSGFVESFNISVAAAVTMYSITRRARAGLAVEERESLRLRWMKEDLRGGDSILEELKSRGLVESENEPGL